MENAAEEITPEVNVVECFFLHDTGQWLMRCGGVDLLYTEDAFFEETLKFTNFVSSLSQIPNAKGDFGFKSDKGGTIQIGNMEMATAQNLLYYILQCRFARETALRSGRKYQR